MENIHPDSTNPNSPAPLDSGGPNVAVIAIHGVGQHLSGVSADAVSTLLMSIGRNGGGTIPYSQPTPPYPGFVATSIEVPLRPVQSPPDGTTGANDRNQPSRLSRIWGIFNERRGFLAQARENADFIPYGYNQNEPRPGELDRGEFAYQFMLTQVAGYKGEPDRNFQTVRLEGMRAAGSSAAKVHIYDAHYSDLTKPENSILAFFFAFYQLLFHLASLSLQAVYWVEAENVKKENVARDKAGPGRWRIESSIHATSVRLLIMWIPFLNLILLEIAVCSFADKTYGWSLLPLLALCFAAVLSLGVTFWLLRKRSSPGRPFLWASIPFLGICFGTLLLSGLACLYNCIFHLGLPFFETLLLLSWLLAAGLILGWIASKYNPLRPGALFLSIVLYVANLLLFLFYLLPHAANTTDIGQNQVATASLWAVQWIFGELLLSWTLCLICAFISWPLSAFCVHGIKEDKSRKSRAIAAFRTGRFAFAVPTLLFVIVTCALWSGGVVYGSDKLKAFDGVTMEVADNGPSSSQYLSIVIPEIKLVECWIDRATSPATPPDCEYPTHSSPEQTVFWSKYLTGLLLVSVTPAFPATMIMLIVGLLLLTWAVLPSLVFELKPKLVEGAPSDRIRSLGEWLSRGLDNTAIITRMLWFAIVPLPLSFLAFDWLVLHRILPHSLIKAVDFGSRLTLPLIRQDGLVLAVSGATLFGFILKYLTTVLDTILDVDNYLRTSPKEGTPRALIAERCTSLLRYIAAYRDDQNRRPYSKVIIVAHSLGSMVTTDLLAISSALRTTARTEAWPDTNSDKYPWRRVSRSFPFTSSLWAAHCASCSIGFSRICIGGFPISRTTRSPLSPPQSILPCPRSVPPSPGPTR
jgi:hypothetical protein